MPIQLEYASYRPDPARRAKIAAVAIAACIVFLSIGALGFATAAVLEATRRLGYWGDVLYLAIYALTLSLLALLWSLGRTRVLLLWNSLVLGFALSLSLIAWAH